MRKLLIGIALVAFAAPAFADTLKEVTQTLSSDLFEGRAPTTPGEDKTIGYIAGRMAAAKTGGRRR